MQPLTENTVNVPAFLSKLWKMVNDPGTDHLICWSPAGNSFHIQNQAQFWYELLPLYYKHNNMSSFVRQLNMYGFHKMSVFENGTMDADKDEIQFYHPYFQKDKPELLKNIKRKVTGSKHSSDSINGAIKGDELLKVLDDVKQLRGRQANVDSQLAAMKHENAVLWRELAMLRQKHIKQQQIVNKLIQFLVTCVHPRGTGGLSVKRRYPLMLNESPHKKSKSNNNVAVNSSEGPTIHELDNADVLSEELFQEEAESLGQPENASTETEKVQSPLTPHSTSSNKTSQQGDDNPPTPSAALLDEANVDYMNSDLFWDSPEFVSVKPEVLLNQEQDAPSPTEQQRKSPIMQGNKQTIESQKVFIHPSSQDALLTNLINGSYNTNVLNKGSSNAGKKVEGKKDKRKTGGSNQAQNNMAVATRDPNLQLNRLSSVEDMDQHVETTQSELDQLKDILNGYSSFDANALLGLFNEDAPDYGITYNQGSQNNATDGDPLVSGSELTAYDPGTSLIDFNELFDDSVDVQDAATVNSTVNDQSVVNTPQVDLVEPVFPAAATVTTKKKLK